MRRKSNFRFAIAAYGIVCLAFVAFSVYMLVFEHNGIYKARTSSEAYSAVENVFETEVADSASPTGAHKEYSFEINKAGDDGESLIFYTVHQLVNVKIGSETVFDLTAGGGGMGNSPSSNWVSIPIRPSDYGNKVTVTVTPVYKSAFNHKIDFIVGSKYDFFMHRLKIDLPQLILSYLCILMGILLMVLHFIMLICKKLSSWENFYLGNFSLLVGVWRVTDTRFSAIMFENGAKALGYITIWALFIMPVPLLLFMNELYTGRRRILLKAATVVTVVSALVALLCQITGVAELREMLPLCHIMIIIDMAISVLDVIYYSAKNNKERNARLFVFLLVAGSIVDLIYFYFKGTSSGMLVTMLAFLVCTFYQLIESVLESNRKVYFDETTHLFNKTGWDEYIAKNVQDGEQIGIMMFDLNNLKGTNDTLGHKEGDKIIFAFAEILRKTFGSFNFLCRWGGDEFAVLVRNADKPKIINYISEINNAVERYNSLHKSKKLYFACGYALSSEFEGLSKHELFKKADEFMYRDKKKWHDENTNVYYNV